MRLITPGQQTSVIKDEQPLIFLGGNPDEITTTNLYLNLFARNLQLILATSTVFPTFQDKERMTWENACWHHVQHSGIIFLAYSETPKNDDALKLAVMLMQPTVQRKPITRSKPQVVDPVRIIIWYGHTNGWPDHSDGWFYEELVKKNNRSVIVTKDFNYACNYALNQATKNQTALHLMSERR